MAPKVVTIATRIRPCASAATSTTEARGDDPWLTTVTAPAPTKTSMNVPINSATVSRTRLPFTIHSLLRHSRKAIVDRLDAFGNSWCRRQHGKLDFRPLAPGRHMLYIRVA